MPKSKQQNQLIIDQRKECILHSALVLFSLYGYRSVGLDDIAKVSKCSRALVYHYFNDKEALFKTLMHDIATRMHAILATIDYETKAQIALHELLNELLTKIKDGDDNNYIACVLYLLLNLHLQKDYIPKPPIKDEEAPIKHRTLFEIVYYLVEKGQKEGDFYGGNVKEYTIAILSLIKGLAYNKMYLKDKFTCPSVDIVMHIVNKKD